MRTTDWLIVGNGVVGATTACLLADAGFSVTLLDSHPRPLPVSEDWDIKTYSLTPASRRILSAIGAWSQLDPARVAPYDRMAVWEHGEEEGIAFDAAANARPALGYMLEQSRLLAALHAELLQLYMYCLSRVVGALDLARARAEDARLVAEYFAKLGVACHLDGAPPPRRRRAIWSKFEFSRNLEEKSIFLHFLKKPSLFLETRT